MVTRPDTINVAPSSTSPKSVAIVLCGRRKGEVHQMGDGGLTSATVGISYGSLDLIVSPHSLGAAIHIRIPP
jgi:hypothetical protein